ncbi:MAG TPA: hypothetical protein VGG39_37520 [Polyangiaceae bacterium]|jgi:hypothetical protein
MGPEFWQTPMGRRFFEHTLPELIQQMTRLAEAIEALIAQRARKELRKP